MKASYTDTMGYTSIVFENLDFTNEDYRFIMCVMFPNWEHPVMNIGDTGYVSLKYVREGVDKWFDGKDFNVYRYTNIIFLKFVKEKDSIDIKSITID